MFHLPLLSFPVCVRARVRVRVRVHVRVCARTRARVTACGVPLRWSLEKSLRPVALRRSHLPTPTPTSL